MSVPVLTFFNNKGGVGKTSLVYHLSWMFSEFGLKVVAVDLDAQANLTAAFLDEEELEKLWEEPSAPTTIYQAIKPLTQVGDVLDPRLVAAASNLRRVPGDEVLYPRLVAAASNLHLVPGDVALASFEDTLSGAWPGSMGDGNLYRPFRILTAFWQVAQMAAKRVDADLILVDVGPNLGAINRAALIASDFVAIPLGADLFSLQGLKNLGDALRSWRESWGKRLANWKSPDFELPQGKMGPVGYIVQQHMVRLSRPVKAYDKWVNRMPKVYHESVLQDSTNAAKPADDNECLTMLKHYRSLIPMGQEARKPIFHLTPADGAIGSHADAVTGARKDIKQLAETLLDRMGIALP